MSQTQDPIQQQGHQDPYWRSLEQLEDPAAFRARNADEFAEGASEPPVLDDVSRRKFMGIAAASAALAGMTSCRKPYQKILPFGIRPEHLVPGNPSYYATAHVAGGRGTGILVRSSDGRPTKVEGNPMHPASGGATDHLMQAELLNLYDPARAQKVYDLAHAPGGEHAGHDHDPTLQELLMEFNGQVAADGADLHILMEPTTSPSLLAALDRLKQKRPAMQIHTWAPVNERTAAAATAALYGQALDTHYDLTKADVVVAVECDFQSQDGDSLRNARAFASRRRVTTEAEAQKIARLYAIESFHSVTGSNADHRLRVRASEVGDVVMALAHELGKLGVQVGGDTAAYASVAGQHKFNGKAWLPVLAKDLAANRGASALMIGPRLPQNVQVVLHAINHALGNVGKTVTYTKMPASLATDGVKSLQDLVTAIDDGWAEQKPKRLVILGGNPIYTAPADLELKTKFERLGFTCHLSLFFDETGRACKWHVNQAHDLEAWGDVLSRDGTATLIQPLIAPLYDGVSALEFVELLANGFKDNKVPSGYDLVRDYWKTKASGNFETFWARALHDGVVPGTAAATVSVSPNASAVTAAIQGNARAKPGSIADMEVQFRPSYNVADGRYSNNAWLLELPDPMTKITWDNAALVSLKTLNELRMSQGDVATFTLDGRSVKAPVWVLPGHADYSVTMTLGFGRDLDAKQFPTAHGAGFNAYALRTAAAQNHATGLTARPTGAHYEIAVTQEHGSMEGRAIVRENSVAGYQAKPTFAPDANPLAEMAAVHNAVAAKHHKEHGGGEGQHEHKVKTAADYNKSLWPSKDLPEEFVQGKDAAYQTGYQWGMVIDLNTCIGCNACVAACVSENNIATVGKEQVAKGREMHWNRIDRYFGTETESNHRSPGIVPDFNAIPPAENPKVVHQMVPCMQCENASCEVVCPVAATTHTPEGLNDMVYNRCIGTRYCGNNCPYKVRHFNYLDYHGEVPEQIKMARNPDVTIRSRGVMEKCTYCVQRINRKKIEAKRDGRRALRDGEIATACEQSCPTQAITFGDINDPESRVAKLKQSNLNYGLLAEMNMRPRTTYLAKIRNPNPELA